MNTSGQAYRQVGSRRWRWLLMMLVIPIPYVIYTTILDTSQTNLSGWLLPFVFLILTVVILGMLMNRNIGLGPFYLAALVCTAVAEVPWVSDPAHPADVWAYPLLMLGIVYRLRRLDSAVSLIEENRSSFVFELMGIALATFFMLLMQMDGGVREWLIFVMMAGLAVRIYTMWKAERAETNTEGAKGNFGMILVAAIALLWFGPRLLYWLVLAVAGGGAVISLPFLYLLNALLPKHMLASGLKQQNMRSQLVNSLLHQQHPTSSGHSFDWILKVLYVIAFVAAVVLVWRLSKKQLVNVGDKDTDGAVTIRRTRIRAAKSRSFFETDDPTRRRYQQLLDAEDKAGYPIAPNETPTEYEARLEQLAGEGKTERPGNGLTHTYEEVRYGKPNRRQADRWQDGNT